MKRTVVGLTQQANAGRGGGVPSGEDKAGRKAPALPEVRSKKEPGRVRHTGWQPHVPTQRRPARRRSG
jgi:hypothetical protein